MDHDILLTGGTGTIGSAILRHLTKAGMRVCAPKTYELNVLDHGMIERFCLNRVFSALILAHGTYGVIKRMKDSPEEYWRRAIDVNLVGTACLIYHANVVGPIIVFGGARGGSIPMVERSSYAASKAGVNAIVVTGAAEGLKIYGVAPGPMQSKMQDMLFARASSKVKDEMIESLKHGVGVEKTLRIIDDILGGHCEPGLFYSAREL